MNPSYLIFQAAHEHSGRQGPPRPDPLAIALGEFALWLRRHLAMAGRAVRALPPARAHSAPRAACNGLAVCGGTQAASRNSRFGG
ncbi:MAG TPA: hypothetical protein VME46_04825 [Acidimicrobiales bacterium]|nr:hypothetical protein [Acidimicrobiales bacterium]